MDTKLASFSCSNVALLLLCCMAMTQASSSECEQMQDAQQRCFSDLNLAGMDGQIQSLIEKNPTAVCTFQEKYKTAIECAMNLAKRCLSSAGQRTDILPDVDMLLNGINYLCQNIDNVDVVCLQQSTSRLKSCATDKAMTAFTGSSNVDDVRFITCKAFNLTAECLRETLVSCPLQTMSVFVKYTEDYLYPPACRSGNSFDKDSDGIESEYRFTTLAPMTTARLVTVVPLLPNVQCYSETSIQAGQRKCFSQEGIDIQLPQVSTQGGSSQAKQSYLDAILANNRDINMLCQRSQLEKYERALVCAMDVTRQCMPASYKDYLPASSKMSAMLNELCNSADVVDQTCVTNHASALFDCGYRKAQEMQSRDVKSLLCSAFKFNVVCQKEVLPTCGCQTAYTYVKISKMYLNPPACPSIEEPSPVCDVQTGQFISGGVDTIRASIFSLLLSAGLFLAFALRG